MLSPEQIQANFETFREFCAGVTDRSENLLAFIDYFDERLALCPASSRKTFHRSTPGGLVEHSLRVLKNAIKLNKAFGWGLDKNSLVVACLFHDIGKIGDKNHEYYVSADDWKSKKFGNLYQVNYDLPFMQTPARSVFLMQQFGIKLSQDEYLAILLNDGYVVDANKDYCLKEPLLATCVMTADYIATAFEKDEENAAEKAELAKKEAKRNSAKTDD